MFKDKEFVTLFVDAVVSIVLLNVKQFVPEWEPYATSMLVLIQPVAVYLFVYFASRPENGLFYRVR